MPPVVADVLARLLHLYVGIGVVFAPAFAWRGAARLVPVAAGGTTGFRLLLLPGAVLLWPWLLARWRRAAMTPPAEAA